MTTVSTMADSAAAWKLIERYDGAAAICFAAPQQTLLAHCRYIDLIAQSQADGLAASVRAALERAKRMGEHNPLVIGAVPFEPSAPAYLALPSSIEHAGPLCGDSQPQPLTAWRTASITPVPTPTAYTASVAQAVAQIRTSALHKVVLARGLHIQADAPLDLRAILANLAQHNQRGYTFAVPLPTRRTLIGASPELLIARHGLQISAQPLAGSIARATDPHTDARRAADLLRSSKDLHEHAVVVEAVAATLGPLCTQLHIPAPTLVATPTMWHLATSITGQLRADGPSALELALALHPTPAVCGTPTAAARQAIDGLEPFERGFFTGLVGWCDAHGDGEWAIAIRCAEIVDRTLHLYAGAGIVADSDPHAELVETAGKLRTMLLALGLDQEELL